LQQRLRQQRCFLHFTLQHIGAQQEGAQQAGAPQVGSQQPALADDRLARYIKPVASIAATNARLFMGRLLKTQETLKTFVAEPPAPHCQMLAAASTLTFCDYSGATMASLSRLSSSGLPAGLHQSPR
jgi:hypothetical protein